MHKGWECRGRDVDAVLFFVGLEVVEEDGLVARARVLLLRSVGDTFSSGEARGCPAGDGDSLPRLVVSALPGLSVRVDTNVHPRWDPAT